MATSQSQKSEFLCSQCQKKYSSQSSLCNHKKKYHPPPDNIRKNQDDIREISGQNPEISKEKTYDCRHCDKKYKHLQTRWSHEQICKEIAKNRETQQIQQQLEKLKQENEILKLKNQLQKAKRLNTKTFKAVNKILIERSMQNSSSSSSSNNIIHHNTTNHNTINNTYQIFAVGNEELQNVLTLQQKREIMNARLTSLEKIVEIAHCGNYNGFKNIIITNLKDNYAYKYDEKRGYFVTIPKTTLLNDLVSHRITDIEAIYDELDTANKIDEKTKKMIQDFLDKIANEDTPYFDENNDIQYQNYKSYKINNVKILLYNNQDKITKDIALLISDNDIIST